jgi:hypothetical protein
MVNIGEPMKTRDDIQIQVPVDVTVEEPGARVVGEEPNRYDVVRSGTSAHNITNDRVIEVVGRVSSAPNHVEGVLERWHVSEHVARARGTTYPMQMNRVLMFSEQ